MPLVILISGESGTGKTTLGKVLAKELSIPFFSRDGLKETMFDTLGVKDREWSHTIGITAYELMYSIAESLIKAQVSFILESTFKAEDTTERLNEIKSKYPFLPFQIRLKSNNDALLKRFKDRVKKGERHPGHTDTTNIDDFEKLLDRNIDIPFFNIGGEILEFDTTEFEKLDIENLLERIGPYKNKL